MTGPLARIGAIKLKLGALLVGGVATTSGVVLLADAAGLPLWLSIAIATGVGLVTIELLGTGLTAPLGQMAEQAARLADGRQVEPVDGSARDEVGALARAFNEMAREVARTDRLRRDLVANVSHELRTPLAAMSAVVENLVDGVDDASPETLARLEAQTLRLRDLVDQLLDLSQLDAGAVRLDRVPVAVATLVDEAVAACGEEAGRRVVLEAEIATLTVDPLRFRQVLVNLVGNALRHGPDGEPVTITATRDLAGCDVLVVADTGPGIAPDDAERVFGRFARTDDGRSADRGGAGLGLAIARWVVALHGGTLGVELHDGPGARLRVTLPTTTDGARTSATGGDVASSPQLTAASPTAAEARAPTSTSTSTSTSTRAVTPVASTTRTPNETPTKESTVSTHDVPPPPGAALDAATDRPPPPGDAIEVLPTPIAGVRTRALVAVAVAALVAALLGSEPFDAGTGLGMVLLLGTGGAATLVALERRLDSFARACTGLALGVVVSWAVTDALWVLVPATVVAVLVAGLGLWGPRRAGEVLRALVVGPLLAVVAPLALARGAQHQRAGTVRRAAVPVLATLLVVLVFGGLLAQGDAAFARLVDALLPDLTLDLGLVGRLVLGVLVAITCTTYVLVQRAGTIATTPWARPSRPRRDWLAPLLALDGLLALAIVVRLGVLFGGAERVLETTGLTYAEYARSGFGSLLALATLVLGVVAVVARVADHADRRTRDQSLGVLLGATIVVLVSAAQRLALYTAEFGLTRLRFSAAVAIAFVGIVIVLVAVAGRTPRVAAGLPRALVVLIGGTVLAVALARPDAVIARQQVAAFGTSGQLDLDYLAGLSADAAPAVDDLSGSRRTAVVLQSSWTCDPPASVPDWMAWNLSRATAIDVVGDIGSAACDGPRLD